MAPSTLTIAAAAVAATVVLLTWGIPLFLAEYFPWRSLYNQRVMPQGKPTVRTKSYKGRTVLVTGANGAFGSRVSKFVARREVGTLVLVDVRDCGGVKQEIEAELKEQGKPVPNIIVWQADLMTFAGCQELAKKVQQLENLDHVLMTAGILSYKRFESPEGWETSVQVNYLSGALVALLILPALKSSPSNPNPPVLTFVTTFAMYPSSFTMGVPKRGSYLKKLSNNRDGLEQGHQYGRSKALLLYFARELASRTSPTTSKNGLPKATINSADPGSAWTPLTSPSQSKLIPRLIMNFGAREPEICATALLNGVSVSADGHGKIMQDHDEAAYPPFMMRKSGLAAQKRAWEETRAELEAKVPEVKAIYAMLD